MRVQTRRSLLVDAALGVALALMGWWAASFAWDRPDFDGRGHGGPHGPVMHVVAVSGWAVGALVILAAGVTVRRLWPRAGFVVATVGVGGYLAAGGSFGPILFGPALAVFALAVRLPLRRWLPWTALLLPMVIVGHWREPYGGALDPGLYAQIVGTAALTLLPALFALLHRARRENDQRDRELDRRRSAYEERLRIARDVHDGVGHSLAVVTMQAGVALHLLEKARAQHPPTAVDAQVAESLEAIRTSSREAMAELRTTLGVFREGDIRAPAPGLDRLDDLVGALRQAGRTVEVQRDPAAAPPLPAAVDQAAFRIVQEALTNVVRHAGSAAAHVRLRRTEHALEVEVTDDGPAPGHLKEGNGIRGMRERASAVGGTVLVAPSAPRGLRVRAELPVPTAGP